MDYIAAPPTNEAWFKLAATEVNSSPPALLDAFLMGQRSASQFRLEDLAQINDNVTATLGKSFGVSVTDLNVSDSVTTEASATME